MTAYTVSKAGVAALTVAVAEEVAKDGILVNAVAPSTMDTPANRKAMPEDLAQHAVKRRILDRHARFLAVRANEFVRAANSLPSRTHTWKNRH